MTHHPRSRVRQDDVDAEGPRSAEVGQPHPQGSSRVVRPACDRPRQEGQAARETSSYALGVAVATLDTAAVQEVLHGGGQVTPESPIIPGFGLVSASSCNGRRRGGEQVSRGPREPPAQPRAKACQPGHALRVGIPRGLRKSAAEAPYPSGFFRGLGLLVSVFRTHIKLVVLDLHRRCCSLDFSCGFTIVA